MGESTARGLYAPPRLRPGFDGVLEQEQRQAGRGCPPPLDVRGHGHITEVVEYCNGGGRDAANYGAAIVRKADSPGDHQRPRCGLLMVSIIAGHRPRSRRTGRSPPRSVGGPDLYGVLRIVFLPVMAGPAPTSVRLAGHRVAGREEPDVGLDRAGRLVVVVRDLTGLSAVVFHDLFPAVSRRSWPVCSSTGTISASE